MNRLPPGLDGGAGINVDIFLARREAIYHIDVGGKGTGQVKFQLVAKRRSMIGHGNIDAVVGDISVVDIGKNRTRGGLRSSTGSSRRLYLVDEAADQLVIPFDREVQFILQDRCIDAYVGELVSFPGGTGVAI